MGSRTTHRWPSIRGQASGRKCTLTPVVWSFFYRLKRRWMERRAALPRMIPASLPCVCAAFTPPRLFAPCMHQDYLLGDLFAGMHAHSNSLWLFFHAWQWLSLFSSSKKNILKLEWNPIWFIKVHRYYIKYYYVLMNTTELCFVLLCKTG